ncbi:MAG: CHAT domain-containing protein [Chitinophagaceae bacterium]|nr:CHAT domain-containing protein [Chitinophagaceae bacterium]
MKANNSCNYRSALNYYKKASRISITRPSLEAYRRKGLIDLEIGNLHAFLGNYNEAIVCLSNAYDEISDASLREEINLQLGSSYYKIGEIAKAREILNNLSSATDFNKIKSKALHYLGLTYHRQMSFDTALQFYCKAVYLARSLDEQGKTEVLIPVCQNLVALYAIYNDFKAAHECLDSLSMYLPEVSLLEVEAEINETRGMLFLLQKQFPEAESSFLKSNRQNSELENCKQNYILLYLGDLYYQWGKYEQSAQYYDTCYQLFHNSKDHNLRNSVIIRMAYLANALNHPQKALHYFNQMERFLNKQPTDDNELLFALNAGLAKTYELLKDVYRSEYYYIKAVSINENLREFIAKNEIRQLFLQSRTNVYESLVRLMYNKCRLPDLSKKNEISCIDSAFYFSEKSKSRVLSEILAAKSEKEFHQFEDKSTLSSVSQILQRPNELIVEYEVTDSATYIFIIRNKKILDFIKMDISRSWLYMQCTSFRKAILKINDPLSKNQMMNISNDLYNKIISQWVKYINTNDRVIIIPDELLLTIPFEALIDQMSDEKTGKPLRYLLQLGNFTISYYPSATLITNNRLKKRLDNVGKSLLAYGISSTYGGACCPEALESNLSEAEASMIASECKSYMTSVQTMLGYDATEQSLKSQALHEFQIIHLSTHGYLDGTSCASQPFLRFNDVANYPEDGCLTIGEIYQLYLNADLVTLSACDSGNGEIIQGEGLTGLSHAFFAAGARSLLVSQWGVYDRSTLQLMNVFYYNICNGLDKSTALRKSKENLITDQVRVGGETIHYNAPFFWAPFILIGEYD